jgi:pyrroloquinoline quinone (PQQ) biosynthesis protein C
VTIGADVQRKGFAMKAETILEKLDAVVDAHCRRGRLYNEETTPGRARMFVLQHRQNTRQRNSVLKLRVATNCPDWATRLRIIAACSQEILADHEFGGGKAHWQILEELGTHIGLTLDEIRAATPLPTTEIAWAAWEGLMSNRHWLEGIIANTCAERVNVPGYGAGAMRDHGWSWVEHERWRRLFGLDDAQLAFWEVHEKADLEHSNLGWQAVAQHAAQYRMEEAAVHACEINLRVWELYFNGIAEACDRLDG